VGRGYREDCRYYYRFFEISSAEYDRALETIYGLGLSDEVYRIYQLKYTKEVTRQAARM